ncbi:family 16 glycosylhydrolase [Labilibaculum sp.]|uniref:glycoside hydrolase family 16 protein n=1 Tax=Labilibaculum sp. TaxID=2060723 RepID=UPI003568040D
MNFFLAYRLRKASDTLSIEKKRDALQKDFEEFKSFSISEELKDYRDLEAYVLADRFKTNRKSIENKSYKKSTLFKDEKNFKRFQRSSKFKTYFRLKDSSELSTFELTKVSDEIKRYKELDALIHSAGFSKKTQSEEFNEFTKLKSSQLLKEFFKFEKSKSYKTYKALEGSNELNQYLQLEEKISSDEFQKEKAYLLDKKRFEKSEDYQKLQKYLQLKESDKYKKYFALATKNPFQELDKWELSFSDEFDSKPLQAEKWINKYFWGEELLNKGYNLQSELQCFTEGQNIDYSTSSVLLQARKETVKGLQWDPSMGFVPTEFDYSSAIISTGKSFRQKFGRFEAKIKLNNPNQVTHSFWMVSDQKLPHIDVFKSLEDGKLQIGNYWGNEKKLNKHQTKVKGVDLSKGYFIYCLEWTQNKLVWKINDVVVKTQSEGVPQDPMYLNFSMNITKEQPNVNACFEIDWVRCYQAKE